MKQEDGKGIGDPVHKYYFFPSEARDFSRGYFTSLYVEEVATIHFGNTKGFRRYCCKNG